MATEEQEKLKAAIHWMETMKERLDHYEVHRNEFLSDMRLPPRNVKFLREVLLPFCENTLLLDNIAKSEGLCYWKDGKENRLRIIVRVERDGKMHEVITNYPELVDINSEGLVCYNCNFPYLLKHKDFDHQKPEDNTLAVGLNGRVIKAGDSEYDFEICLPHEHTIYSILENVIRNSAKHNVGKFKPLNASGSQGEEHGTESGEKTLLETLDIHVDITEADADHYQCTIYDNVSLAKLSKVDSGERIAELADLLERKKKPLLQDGRPNRANMGMADMKINAFLLKSAEDFTEPMLNDALDMVICDRCTDGGHEHAVVRMGEDGTLKKYAWEDGKAVEIAPLDPGTYLFGYRFKLTKAKKVAWIGKAAEGIAKSDNYKRAGICGYATWAKYSDSLNETLAAYEVAVLEVDVWKEIQGEDGSKLRGNLAQLPYRVLVNSTGPCSVPSPFDRRVIVGSLNATTECDLLLSALSTWVKGKYKKPLLVRGYLSDPKKVKSPCNWKYTDTDPVIDFELHFKAPTLKQEICASDDALLWSIDHHGELTKAFCFPQVGTIEGHEYFKFSNCLDRAYTFSGKANPDHDRMVSTLQRSDQNSDELMSMVDRFHRRIVIVDERVAEMVAGKDNPHNDLKVIPADLWAALAAMNIYVVTGLSICEERSFWYETNNKSSLHLELNGSGSHTFNWKSEDKSIPVGVDLASLSPILEKADTLISHRTHWLKFKEMKLDTGIRAQFGDVVITSGAGKPEGLQDLKYLSFATLMTSVSATGASKLGLAQVVDGLTIKPLKQ